MTRNTVRMVRDRTEIALRLISRDDVDAVQLALVAKRFEGFIRMRWLIGPISLAPLVFLFISDPSTWRRLLLAGVVLAAILRSVVELRKPDRPVVLYGNRRSAIVMTALLLAAPLVATGGMDSPILPFLIPVCFFFGTVKALPSVMGFAAVAILNIVAMTIVSAYGLIPDLLPAVFGGVSGQPQSLSLLLWRAGGFVAALVYSATVSNLVRKVFRQMVGDALDARDEVLRNHEAHARELTALTGELAHELKNPLANLKGLAVLVGRDVHGKGVERLEVLQHEIGRMEEILHNFLTFSRPLTPLCQEQVDLEQLCASVVSLHEGMAQNEGVSLTLRATPPVMVWCDPRKVKQILINLVQNALDASPPGANVAIVVQPAPDGGTLLEVRDEGPGIAPNIRAHLFEPGTTTKERGNGLGLALARALARQHGGDLSVENGEAGGCTAALRLPIPAARPASEAS